VFALLVIAVLALPYLIWVIRADTLMMPHWPDVSDLHGRALHWARLLGGLLLAISGIAVLVVLDSGWFSRTTDEAPIIFRPPVEPLARSFVYFFAIMPALAGSLIAGLFDLDRVVGGAGIALLLAGLAVIVTSGDLVQLRRQRALRTVWAAAIALPALAVFVSAILLPWTGSVEVPTSLPAKAIARFSGDPQLASLVSLDGGRPHLFLGKTPERTPWLTAQKFNQTGGVVVWRASDTDGTPPADIAQLFPGLVPEVPRAFDWLVNGRQPLLRVGWAIVRPKGP
jgi:hypothetical protein